MLTDLQAQQIVNKMSSTLTYGIIITNEIGMVIASNRYSSIGKINKNAAQAIEINQKIELDITDDNPTPQVITPILFKEQPIGAIGILTKPEEANKYIELLKITSELLIQQEYLLNSIQTSNSLRDEFLHEWLYYSGSYSPNFINRGLAMHIDITIRRNALLVMGKEGTPDILTAIKKISSPEDLHLRLQPNIFVILMKSSDQLKTKLSLLSDMLPETKIAVGLSSCEMSTSLNQAHIAINVGQTLRPDNRIFCFEDFEFAYIISKIADKTLYLSVIEKILDKGKTDYLLDTFLEFMHYNGEINKISASLHIHRNSLNYRLDKIHELTGRNPRCYMDMIFLYTAYICYMFHNNKEADLKPI